VEGFVGIEVLFQVVLFWGGDLEGYKAWRRGQSLITDMRNENTLTPCCLNWADIRQDLEAPQEVEITSSGNKIAVRTECKGICGKLFQAVGVAMPPVIRSLEEMKQRSRYRKKRCRSATQEKCVHNQLKLQ